MMQRITNIYATIFTIMITSIFTSMITSMMINFQRLKQLAPVD